MTKRKKKKEKIEIVAATPMTMFNLIDDFSRSLLEFMKEYKPQLVDEELMMMTAGKITTILRESGLEGRIAVVTLLNLAVASYRVGCEQEILRQCPSRMVN